MHIRVVSGSAPRLAQTSSITWASICDAIETLVNIYISLMSIEDFIRKE